MKQALTLIVAVLTALAVTGPASSVEITYHLVGVPEVYTLVNLHPDEGQRLLYSVNYLREGLIPLCTRVRIDSVDRERMLFTLIESGHQYTWAFHRSLRDPIAKHLDRFFGKTCDKKRIESMSRLDQDGIAQGKVFPGMTKDGVILAIGYPPEHATPTVESNAWRYWKNRFNTILVHFVDGKVLRVQD
ncbi:MAG: hypothetical protein HYS14_03360 [Candidatus Rokubacteria bacterium]|nr:hypothetical protein [Candidatus Rokubacteria bacterium]